MPANEGDVAPITVNGEQVGRLILEKCSDSPHLEAVAYWDREVCCYCGTVDPEPWEVDPNDPPAWACDQDPNRCSFCGGLLD